MDSRDIKEQPSCSRKNYLLSMYEMQKTLINHYVSIEGLPNYPVNVNTKASQTLLKDFTGRVIEELAESYEAREMVYASLEPIYPRLWQMVVTQHKPLDCDELALKFQAVTNHLQNVGEEMADAMHFFLELFIYANIQPEDILRYVDVQLKLNHATTENPLDYIQSFGVQLLSELPSNYNHLIKPYNAFNLLDVAVMLMPDQTVESLLYLKCGSMITNKDSLGEFDSVFLWEITYHLNIARNYLKNKPWKQSEVMTQESKYQEELVKAFIYFMGYLKYLGCDQDLVYFLYFKKNKVNQFRIQSNY